MDPLDPLAKQGLEVKLVKEDLKAIKESRVQWDLLELREIGVCKDFLDPVAKQGPRVIFSCRLDLSAGKLTV